MKWFFEDAAAVQRLRNAAAEWNPTPFRPFSRAKGPGGGIDCVGFVEELMVAAGAVEPFAFPRTDADYQSNRTPLRILHYLRGEERDDPQSKRLAAIFAELRLPEEKDNLHPDIFMPGDLLVLRDGGQIHIPVMLRGRRFTHCARPEGVAEGNLHDTTFSKHLVAAFRARAVKVRSKKAEGRGKPTAKPKRKKR